jgi:hypothetical protein
MHAAKQNGSHLADLEITRGAHVQFAGSEAAAAAPFGCSFVGGASRRGVSNRHQRPRRGPNSSKDPSGELPRRDLLLTLAQVRIPPIEIPELIIDRLNCRSCDG